MSLQHVHGLKEDASKQRASADRAAKVYAPSKIDATRPGTGSSSLRHAHTSLLQVPPKTALLRARTASLRAKGAENFATSEEAPKQRTRANRATIAIKLYAPSMIDTRRSRLGPAAVRRCAEINLLNLPPKIARPRSRKGSIGTKCAEKFANSYGACVSSPRSYRRKPSTAPLGGPAEVERNLRRNIAKCRRSLGEQRVRVRSRADLVGIPAMRAVRAVLLRDVARRLRPAWQTWQRHTQYWRRRELEGRAAKKIRRSTAEHVVQRFLDAAAANVTSGATPPAEDEDTGALKVQKWGRSRDSRKLTLLAGSADGRVSHFGLPRPDQRLGRRGPI